MRMAAVSGMIQTRSKSGPGLRGRGGHTVSSRVRLIVGSPPWTQLSVGARILLNMDWEGIVPVQSTSSLRSPPPHALTTATMAQKRAFAPGANDGEASNSHRPPPALRAGGHCGGLYIREAARVSAALAQPAPLVPKPEDDDDPDMRAALALSNEEEEAKWPHLAMVIRTSTMEKKAQQAVKDVEAWALLDQARRVEEALRRREELTYVIIK
ncbi:hypothetical protein QYE76_033400 [Lolium multiflorum]|uniref:Uncharacterized protein n=1 Tax=Lolium multiflorum TaxID=4521 RepID=A0AAD8QW18_LOLMU|nr:hypothetical protein QYE76_033400 [Lolium multiflorum]